MPKRKGSVYCKTRSQQYQNKIISDGKVDGAVNVTPEGILSRVASS